MTLPFSSGVLTVSCNIPSPNDAPPALRMTTLVSLVACVQGVDTQGVLPWMCGDDNNGGFRPYVKKRRSGGETLPDQTLLD